jgi:hypothetical protein
MPNLRGKKYKVLPCGCCEAQDFRDWYAEKLSVLEIREAKASHGAINLRRGRIPHLRLVEW